MLSFDKISALQDALLKERLAGKTIGFVPTMGALHDGHLELIKKSVFLILFNIEELPDSI